MAPRHEASGVLGEPVSLVMGRGEPVRADRVAGSGRIGGAVGIAACCSNDRMGVTGRNDQAPPVVEDVVDRQQG